MPGSYEKGKAISGLEASANAIIFHAEYPTRLGSMTLTAGGRVLACAGTRRKHGRCSGLIILCCQCNYLRKQSKLRSDIGMDVYPKS